jgi:hypothetical protein
VEEFIPVNVSGIHCGADEVVAKQEGNYNYRGKPKMDCLPSE